MWLTLRRKEIWRVSEMKSLVAIMTTMILALVLVGCGGASVSADVPTPEASVSADMEGMEASAEMEAPETPEISAEVETPMGDVSAEAGDTEEAEEEIPEE
jgi:hypothetical protein